MAQLTITEALAELKTIAARLEKKRAAVQQYVARDGRILDPLEKEGGSPEFIARERQAISDLEDRLIRIRCAIQAKNQEVTLTLGGRTRTLAQWLTWRREVAPGAAQFLNRLFQNINLARRESRGRQLVPAGEQGNAKPEEIVIVNVKEAELTGQIEEIATITGDLDGKLSLLNATTLVDVD